MPLAPDGHDTGWLSKYAYQVDSLTADAIGRQAIEDGYFAATAAMRAKFADGFLTEAKIDTTFFILLLPVARVDSTNVDYCKVA